MIKMQLSDIIDRMTIVKLKMERVSRETFEREYNMYADEVETYYPEVLPYLKALYKVNSAIWDLEADIRKGLDQQLGYEEIGRRAVKIRNINSRRIEIKNKITEKFSGFRELKNSYVKEIL